MDSCPLGSEPYSWQKKIIFPKAPLLSVCNQSNVKKVKNGPTHANILNDYIYIFKTKLIDLCTLGTKSIKQQRFLKTKRKLRFLLPWNPGWLFFWWEGNWCAVRAEGGLLATGLIASSGHAWLHTEEEEEARQSRATGHDRWHLNRQQ